MSLDDLSTSPTPDRQLTPEVEEYLEYLDGLCDDEEVYGFATETLCGIRETVRLRNRVTDAQRVAVRNIVRGGDDAQARREDRTPARSRRYEGFSR